MIRLFFGFIGIFLFGWCFLSVSFDVYTMEENLAFLLFSILFVGISLTGSEDEN
jgi:hypothetical protein